MSDEMAAREAEQVGRCARHVDFEGRRYALRDGESVLDALIRGGARVTFSCRKGSCRSCLLQVERGDPGERARQGLPEEQAALGVFMPCLAYPGKDLTIRRADLSSCFSSSVVYEKKWLAPGVLRVSLELERRLTWRAGQFVNVLGPGGELRSFSIASIAEEDYFLDLHVEVRADGAVSGWLAHGLEVGDELSLQGPFGACFYDPDVMDGRPLLLIGTGTGISPLEAIARDAVRHGHRGKISLYHGARKAERLFRSDELEALALRHPDLEFHPCLSGGVVAPGVRGGRALDLAYADHPMLAGYTVFLCGRPDMVFDARAGAVARGARREDILSDPFEPATPFVPEDKAKIASIEGNAPLWRALDEGRGLMAILEDFYARVYADPRLEPYFHRVTKERAIQKQFEFLKDMLSGSRSYFGLRPFNAHHWMVISDELFDYREQLMIECMRRYGLAEPFIHEWTALHELFRREIVKGAPRGLVVDGEERWLEGYTSEVLAMAMVCDGCHEEMASGSTGRMHERTGELFCANCSATRIQPLPTGRPPSASSSAPPRA